MKNNGTSAGVGDGFVEIPDDLGQGRDELLLADHLGHMPRADRLGRRDGDVDLGEASRSKPVVKVISRGLCRIARAAMAVESIPPDRNAPTVTSARMCLATESPAPR